MSEIIRFAGIIRKSPTKKGVEDSIQNQREAIRSWCYNFAAGKPYVIDWFIDKNVSGDDPNRPELNKLFNKINDYDVAVAHVVDRYVRSHIGLQWFFEYFCSKDGLSPHSGCKLYFVTGCPELYDSDNVIVGSNVAVFGMFCLMSYAELLNIRRRTEAGRTRIKKNPTEWKQKFPGRKVGSKNKVKK